MEDRRDVNPDDVLDRAVDAVLCDPIPGELPPDRVAQLVAVVRQAADQPFSITLMERIRNMKPRTKIAVAATVLLTVVGLLSWLVPGGGVAVAFADIAEALNHVHSATWKTTSVAKRPHNEAETVHGIGMFLAPSHERMERTERGEKSIGIFDGQMDRAIVLLPARKTAIVINLKHLPPENPLGRTFQDLRKLVTDAQGGKGGKAERLGTEVIDGRRAEGFRVRQGSLEVKVWADPKTSLPIRVEETAHGEPEVRFVMTDFQIDAHLDPSLFSLDVPKGYTVQQSQFDFSKKPIACLAEMLGKAAQENGGVFPPTLQGEQGIDGIMRRAATALGKKYGKNSPEMLKAGSDIAMKMGASFALVLRLSPEHDWHYTGKDVKLNTPNRAIFWWKPKNSRTYQVIYADLSVKELSPEEAKKLSQSDGGPKR